ncbi:MAG TPA: hypothetical protein VGD46_14330 [Rhizobacter sp.]
MNTIRNSWRRPMQGALLLAALVTLPAQGRDTPYLLPIQPALAGGFAAANIGTDVTVSFGGALPGGLVVVKDPLLGEGRFNPRSPIDPTRTLGPPHTDEQACEKAFVLAVAQLVKQARAAKATLVVGVVSFNNETVVDRPGVYECRAGYARTHVDLRGLAAVKGADGAVSAAPPSAPAVTPAAAEAPRAVARHRSIPPPATGFARSDDLSAVPLGDAGKARYLHYLSLPSPKAFVIYETGAWRFYADDADAMTRALDACASESKACWLYAVDDRVVWNADVSRRIGRSAQLGNE